MRFEWNELVWTRQTCAKTESEIRGFNEYWPIVYDEDSRFRKYLTNVVAFSHRETKWAEDRDCL